MEFINAAEFLRQSKEIQEVFLEWWKPQQFDLYLVDNKTLEITLRSDDDLILPIRTNSVWDEKARCIPLFTEGQLRKFIEDKTNRIKKIEHFAGGYEIVDYSDLGNDLLEAYWKVALKVAEEEIE